MKTTYEQARSLGEKIYAERSMLAANPVIQGSPAQRRIEVLDLAARWNGIAIQGLTR